MSPPATTNIRDFVKALAKDICDNRNNVTAEKAEEFAARLAVLADHVEETGSLGAVTWRTHAIRVEGAAKKLGWGFRGGELSAIERFENVNTLTITARWVHLFADAFDVTGKWGPVKDPCTKIITEWT